MPLNTYVLLHSESPFFFDMLCGTTEKIDKINVVPQEYKKYLPISVKQSYECVIVNGLVFIEASEEYLQTLSHMKIINIQQEKELLPFKREQHKTILLADVLYDNIIDELSNKYRKNNLPYISAGNDTYHMTKLSRKMNNIQIKNINDLFNFGKIELITLRYSENKLIRLPFTV